MSGSPPAVARDKRITLEPLAISLGGQIVCEVGPWALHAGERWWIRGPNGSGKSSLLRVLAGKLWPAPGQHARRRFHFDGESTWSPMAAQGRVALLTPDRQNRYLHQDWDLTAAEVVATGFLDTDILHQRPEPHELERLAGLLKQLDIVSLRDRPFLELSQGERRRVLIARALAVEPQVLLLDEFAEGLDRPSRESLWKTLETLAKSGTAIVLTTHRPGPALDGWKTLDIDRAPALDPAAAGTATRTQARQSSDSPPILVRARGDLFLEGQILIRDLDWILRDGEHTSLLGANGAGKTAFLRLLWGELHLAFGGTVVYFEDPGLTVPALRRQVSYFQPDMHAWFRPNQEAGDIILSGLFSTIDLFDAVTEADRRRMRAAAVAFGVDAFLERPFGTLSYGQARRVLLARSLAARPRLALLDEPFDGLDQAVRAEIFQRLEACAASGETTFVLTNHHAEDRPGWIRQQLRIQPDRTLEKLRD